MDITNLIFLIFIIVIIILVVIGLWFPRGRSDWPLNPRATVYLIIGALFFVLLIILINLLSQYIEWADFITSSIYVTIAIFIVLILVGLFFPDGFRRYT